MGFLNVPIIPPVAPRTFQAYPISQTAARRGDGSWITLKHTAEALAAHQEVAQMLVLSRKLGEKILIGDNIYITVVDIDRGKIRLGIEAPRDVPIYRQELLPMPVAAAGAPVIAKLPNAS
jgi:carbon storage regulator